VGYVSNQPASRRSLGANTYQWTHSMLQPSAQSCRYRVSTLILKRPALLSQGFTWYQRAATLLGLVNFLGLILLYETLAMYREEGVQMLTSSWEALLLLLCGVIKVLQLERLCWWQWWEELGLVWALGELGFVSACVEEVWEIHGEKREGNAQRCLIYNCFAPGGPRFCSH
jgi:hypothetical protein